MLGRVQFFMLLLDQEGALAAIPKLLPDDVNQRRTLVASMREVLSVSGEVTGERANRLQRFATLLGVELGEGSATKVAPFDQARAS